MWKKVFILVIVLLVVCGCNAKKNNNINTDVSQENLYSNDDSDKKETKKEYDCSFIRTYRMVNLLDGYQSATNTFDYIVVDSFQSFVPVIVSIPLNQKDNLEVGKYYEFVYSLKGTGEIQSFDDIDYYLENTTLGNDTDIQVELEIRDTEKQGLEQINENICS